ncbi:MAG: hypothetical protein KA146_00120 [Leptospiraceae bacterium]|nr:hypothetical protein [Leptospiraceae bacterium]
MKIAYLHGETGNQTPKIFPSNGYLLKNPSPKTLFVLKSIREAAKVNL